MRKILIASLFAALTVPFAFAAQTPAAGQSQTDTKTKKKSHKKSHTKKNAKSGSETNK